MPNPKIRKYRPKSRRYKKKQAAQRKREKARSSKPKPRASIPGIDFTPQKHSSYFLKIMSEVRVTNYLLVATDTTKLMKSSTEIICNCIGRWRNDNIEEEQLLRTLLMAFPHQNSSTPRHGPYGPDQLNHEEEPFTIFGRNLIHLGEILGNLQQLDPIEFWTKGQHEELFKAVVPMAKDAAKLKRKLQRISDSLIPDLREMRRIAGYYGLLKYNSNLSSVPNPVSAVASFNGQDALDDSGGFESVTDIDLHMSSKNSLKSSHFKASCFRPLINYFQNFFSKKDNKSMKNMNNSNISEIEIKTPTERPSTKNLERITSAVATKMGISIDYILDPHDTKVKPLTKIDEALTPEEIAAWKQMDIASDSDSEISTSHGNGNPHVDANRETRSSFNDPSIMKDYINCMGPQDPQFYLSDNPSVNQNSNNHETCDETCDENCLREQRDNHNPVLLKSSTESKNHNEYQVLFKSKTNALSLMMSMSSEENYTHSDLFGIDTEEAIKLETAKVQSTIIRPQSDQLPLLDKNTYLSNYRAILKEMHDGILMIIEDIRAIERSWMNTTTRATGFKDYLKLGDMLDYIRHTIHLLSDEEFSKQLYPQTRKDIIQGLDPIYREFHSCFIALGELTQIVSTDVFYLKTFMENMPKGDPLVYEFISNSSLGSFDKVQIGPNVEPEPEIAQPMADADDDDPDDSKYSKPEPAPQPIITNYPIDINSIFS